jgi:ADP-ribosylation factor-like protein 1
MKKYVKKIIPVGPANSGKTTLLYQLKYSEFVQTPPTFGFNCETIFFNDHALQFWDIGASDPLQQFHCNYLKDTKIVAFVIDASDRDKIGLARLRLWQLLEDGGLSGLPVIVVGNKCDNLDVMGKEEIAEKLMLKRNEMKVRFVIVYIINTVVFVM